jgi:hypothetical protein
MTKQTATTEAFEPVLNDYHLEKSQLSFSLQLEEDFEISSSFKADAIFESEMIDLLDGMSNETKTNKVPQDYKKKKSEKAREAEALAAIASAKRMYDFIRMVFGKEGWFEIVEYYSEKNESGNITRDDTGRLVLTILSVIAPKATSES